MVQINFAQKQVKAKVVYYGPGMSGKTTNLEVVHQRAPDGNRGELTSISTDGDRTLFFDFMPLDLGTVAGMKTTFQIYTVPGQVYYNSTRKLVLQGVDGVVFVADSSGTMTEQNLESLRNLEENLNEYGKSLATLPHVIQYNKRDLPDALPVDELERLLNPHGVPTFEGVANTGQGVFPTLKGLASLVLKHIMSERGAGGSNLAQTGVRPGLAASGAAPAAGAPTGGVPQAAAPGGVAPQQPVTAGHGPAGNPGTLAASAQPAGLAGQAQAAPQASAQAVANPALHQTATRPRPSDLMQQPQAGVAAQLAPPQQQTRGQARGQSRAAQTPARPKRSKGGLVFTLGFLVVAAAVGALLAKTILTAI